MTGENNSRYTNGWSEWSKHVLFELERLNNQIDKLVKKEEVDAINRRLEKVANKEEFEKLAEHIEIIEEKVNTINIDVATLKMKITMYVAGISIAGTLLINILFAIMQGFLHQ